MPFEHFFIFIVTSISSLFLQIHNIINETSYLRFIMSNFIFDRNKKNRSLMHIITAQRETNIDNNAQTWKYRNLFPNNRNPIIQRLSSLSYPTINIPCTHRQTEQTHSGHETSELIRETIPGIHDFITECARSYGNFA